MRCDGGCGRRRAAAVAAVTPVAVRSGHVVSANLVQAYPGADVGSYKPTDVELRCTPHHLINVVDPPVVVVVVVIEDVVISYDTILYSRSKIFQV
jgi:tRNA A37 N6-isopentenylltransferase MiaA